MYIWVLYVCILVMHVNLLPLWVFLIVSVCVRVCVCACVCVFSSGCHWPCLQCGSVCGSVRKPHT